MMMGGDVPPPLFNQRRRDPASAGGKLRSYVKNIFMIQSIAVKSALIAGAAICSLVLLGAGCNIEPPKVSGLWGGEAEPTSVNNAAEHHSMQVNLGRTFTIELVSNESTGYRWTAQHTRPNIEFVKDEYIPNSRLVPPDTGTSETEPKPIAGAGGTHFFTFSAVQPGYSQVTFYYSRSWEEDIAPLKQVIYDIHVK